MIDPFQIVIGIAVVWYFVTLFTQCSFKKLIAMCNAFYYVLFPTPPPPPPPPQPPKPAIIAAVPRPVVKSTVTNKNAAISTGKTTVKTTGKRTSTNKNNRGKR